MKHSEPSPDQENESSWGPTENSLKDVACLSSGINEKSHCSVEEQK